MHQVKNRPFGREEAPLPPSLILPARRRGVILISNKMLYLKSRVFHTLVPHVPCVTPSHKNLIKSFSSFLSGFSIIQKLEKSVQSLCMRKARPVLMRRARILHDASARSAREFKGKNFA